ncbi:MAG: hypothetical protein M0Q42_12275 [Xanthomonadales bacterium]|nr:hypothetical protein [Xanthomonadales bacterium]
MNRNWFGISAAGKAVLMAAAVAVTFTALPAQALDLDEVLARHYQARGGLDAIKAVDSSRISGSMDSAGNVSPYTMEAKRPGKLRLEFQVYGMTGIQAVDGDSGWQVLPFMGIVEPAPMSADELRGFRNQADMDGALVDWQAKGHSVSLVGSEEIDGVEAWRLDVGLADGDRLVIWLDAERFLDLKWQVHTQREGQPMQMDVAMSDYRQVDALTIPHRLEQQIQGMPFVQVMTVDDYQLNVDIDDARFAMPAAAADAAEDVEEAEPVAADQAQ